ncbi:Flp pilus assembly complex ATPase component TadA, partial [Pseudomonas sp. TNT11]
MSSMPIDACHTQIPHTDTVCAWLMQHAGLKTVDLERARRLSTDASDLLGLLTRLGLVSEIELARAWAALLGAPLLLADAAPPLLDPLPTLTERFMRHYQVVPMGWTQGGLRVLAANPAQHYPFQALAYACDVPIWLAIGPRNEVDTLIERYYGQGRSAMGTLIENLDEQGGALEDIEHLKDMASEAPVIRLVNLILQRAVEQRASDIHIEPFENQLKVRYRVDGTLRDVVSPRKALHGALVSRIKIMAQLDIAEKRLPQDGRIALRVAGRPIDIRVSTVPTGHGERVVMRLLDKQAGRLQLETLGMEAHLLARLDTLIRQPHGIVLVTGPTGSGKTTSLYAALARLDASTSNILTVEDPVEYDLPGISQIQVNAKIDMTFGLALRAILRQDPDIIMIGEIRDLETAQIAVQASLTGHLVLATLHTNDAVSAVNRLIDMGVEPFLLASSLLGVLAQRLVRRLCPHCKQADP